MLTGVMGVGPCCASIWAMRECEQPSAVAISRVVIPAAAMLRIRSRSSLAGLAMETVYTLENIFG